MATRPFRRFQPAGLLLAIPLAALVLMASDCKGVTPIRTLLDDPSRYDGETVRIAGDVQRSVGVLGVGGYELDDGTGRILVVSGGGGAPRSGAKVGVEGTFRAAFTLGSRTLAVVEEKKRGER